MDEIEYKLNTNNAVLVVNAIEKLITNVKLKYQGLESQERERFLMENPELRYLREKCAAKSRVVSLTAGQGLLALAAAGVLKPAHTMSTIITMMSAAHNHSAIISTISGLLILDLKARLMPDQSYRCQFSLRTPQHPFITVLEKNPVAVKEVLTQMHALCTHPDNNVSSNSIELLRPVFLWLMCVPRKSNVDAAPWRLLLSLSEHPQQRALLFECLSWQQICNPDLVENAYAAYSAVADSAIYRQDRQFVMALLPILARISSELIKQGLDPRGCYDLIWRGLSLPAPELRVVSGLTIVLLAENLSYSCGLYLHQLFTLCLNIMNKYELPSLVLDIFVAHSLQWLNMPSCLTESALKVADKILELHRTRKYEDNKLNIPNLISNNIFKVLQRTDVHLSVAVQVLKTWERVRHNPEKLRSWFDSIERVDSALQLELVPFLFGFVLETRAPDICCRALKLVLDLVGVKNELSVLVLPLLLYKVANDANPTLKFECLRGIPRMAVTKENVPTIVSILTKLKSSKSVPASFLIQMYSALVELQPRCYPYLLELLVDVKTVRGDDLKWEIEVAKAVAVKKICEMRASSHGRELVPVLSAILNRCTDAGGAVASCIAIEALGKLWTESVVAPPSTWRALEPKLGRDKRPLVQQGLCKLLSKIPALRVEATEYDKLLSDAARHLWRYISESNYPDVVEAACDALSHYLLTDYSLKDVPEVYTRHVKLPSSYCKTPADAARRPDEVLDYIPCEIWPEVFKSTNLGAIAGVTRLVATLIERELDGYRSGVYQTGASNDPASMTYLQPYSVVRGMMDYIKKQALHPNFECADTILLEMLYAVSCDGSKPLPPLDICFVHELYHRGGHTRRACLQLAARQALVSESARRFMDTYLGEFGSDNMQTSEIQLLFQLLPAITQTMPPNSIRAPIENSLNHAFNEIFSIKKGCLNGDLENVLFVKQLRSIKECLDSEKTHEANKTLLAQFIENYMSVISEDNATWPELVNVCCSLPSSVLERMTSPSSWWEVASGPLRKAAIVRSQLASTTSQLCWLNEIIDAAVASVQDHKFILELIRVPLTASNLDATTKEWFLELMARTQVAFTETENESETWFLCSVLMEVATVLGGDGALADNSCNFEEAVPRSLCRMFTAHELWRDHVSQITEWLIHTRSVRGVSVPHQVVAHCGLLAFRHQQYFSNATVWSRALSYPYHVNIDRLVDEGLT